MLIPTPDELLRALLDLHERIRARVTRDRGFATAPAEGDGGTDFAFGPDLAAEEEVERFCEEWSRDAGPVRVVSEEGERVYPDGAPASKARLRLLVDPIDGTRVLLRDLRSAWSLSAVAPEPGDGSDPRLLDAVVAVQSEIPTSRQDLAERLIAVDGREPQLERFRARTGEATGREPLRIAGSADLDHAFVVFCKFFPEGKARLAALEERVLERIAGDDATAGRSVFFDDQYLSTGGQLWCLATGRYAVVADLRPVLFRALARRGERTGICGHPYDLASVRVAADAGVRFTDTDGSPLRHAMTRADDVGFLAYAGDAVRERVEPALLEAIRELEEE